jgi:hypothetical protein
VAEALLLTLSKRLALLVRDYEMECGRPRCGCDAVQHVSLYSEKLVHAITFAASAAGNGKCCLPSYVRTGGLRCFARPA